MGQVHLAIRRLLLKFVHMISALAWVPRGAAKPVAEEAEPADVDVDILQVKLSQI